MAIRKIAVIVRIFLAKDRFKTFTWVRDALSNENLADSFILGYSTAF
jgi:hypothetical protein